MLKSIVCGVISCAMLTSGTTAGAAVVQVGDFRLSSGAVSTSTAFNTFSFTTRAVVGAPVQVNSTFAGTSQNNDAGTPVSATGSADATDISLQTFSSSTIIRTLSRSDTPAVGGSGTAPTTAGAVVWSFDLTPVASYLSTSNQSLNSISLLLSTVETASTIPFDLYLSYTQPSTGITQIGLSASQSTNYSALFAPGHAAAVGSTVNSNFVVLSKGQTTADLTNDLTALYNGGVRQFNLFAVGGSFGAGRQITIGSTSGGLASGIYLDASPVPEPGLLGVAAAAGLLALRRQRA